MTKPPKETRKERIWREGQEQLDEFFATFGPSVCPICSFYRYGMMHGHSPEKPSPHHCLETVRCPK